MILQFPYEHEMRESIRAAIKPRFEFAEHIYQFWIRAKFRPRKRMARNVFDLSLMLNLQALRLFRTVLEECYRGEAIGASIASRSLFETMIAILFILKPGVRIILEPDNDPRGDQKRTKHGKLKWIANRIPRA